MVEEITVAENQITAFAGVAGSGKNLIARALSGVDNRNGLRVSLAAETFMPRTPSDAARNGIAALYPRPLVFAPLTVLENLGVTRPGPVSRLRKEILPAARELWARLSDEFFPADCPGGKLTPADARRVEIIRALLNRPKLLVLNEALGAFTAAEKQKLFTLLRGRENLTVLFTTADPWEAALADVCRILRDGNLSAPEKMAAEAVRAALYGTEDAGKEPLKNGKTVLEILGMRLLPDSPDISLTLRQGEILGLTGLEGCGVQEFALALAGRLPVHKGIMGLNGKNLRLRRAGAKARARAGLAVYDGSRPDPDGGALRQAAARADLAVLLVYNLETSGETPAAAALREKLPELTAAGKAVILASGNAEELLRYGNTLAVFHQGALCPARAVEKWTPDEVRLFREKGKAGVMSLL